MSTPDVKLKEAVAAREEGRFDAALLNVSTVFGEIAAGSPKADQLYPLTMALWTQLAAEYPPTIDTLAVVRNYHADLLIGGDAVFCGRGTPLQVSRFQLVVELNRILNDSRATHSLFKRMLALAPELATREAFLALPAIVQEGDYVLADRFLSDPQVWLDEINSMSILYPLWPGNGKPPQLAAKLSNFISEVLLRAAILRGLKRDADAEGFVKKVLASFVLRSVRDLAERELAAPGTIVNELAAIQERHSKG